jgi:hypothetical protein
MYVPVHLIYFLNIDCHDKQPYLIMLNSDKLFSGRTHPNEIIQPLSTSNKLYIIHQIPGTMNFGLIRSIIICPTWIR